MNRLEKCKKAVELGFTYNPETGIVTNRYNKVLKSIGIRGYKVMSIPDDKKQVKLYQHQFAWFWVHNEIVNEIDHKNRIKTDNRIVNLRSVTHSENNTNKTVKGYYLDKRRDTFQVEITKDKVTYYIGAYKTEEEAKEAYLNAKKFYHS